MERPELDENLKRKTNRLARDKFKTRLKISAGLTPQTAADLLLIVLCDNGVAMRKTSDGKSVQAT